MGRFSRWSAEEKYSKRAWTISADGHAMAEIKVSDDLDETSAEAMVDIIVATLNLHGQ